MLYRLSSSRVNSDLRSKKTTQWTREIALKAIDLEEQYYALQQFSTNIELLIKFPDPEINEDVVKSFSNKIDEVLFSTPMCPRECIVKLKDNANIEKAIKEISKVRFGGGRLNARRKLTNEQKIRENNVEEVDPFTIFFGNLPNSKISKLKLILQAKDVEIQIGQNKRKPKSYAFAKFKSFEDAVHGFKKCTEKFSPSQFINIRFKRSKVKQTDEDLPPEQSSSHNKADTPVFPIEQISSEEPVEAVVNDARRRSEKKSSNDIEPQVNFKRNSRIEFSTEQENNDLAIVCESEKKSAKASTCNKSSNEELFDPNKKIKQETGIEKYLGFQRNLYDDEEMDGDTDCSGSTYRCSNSSGRLEKKRSHSSNDSVLSLTETDDETTPPTMKKPKLLVLPIQYHGSMRDVKDEKNESSDDDIGDIGDLDFSSY